MAKQHLKDIIASIDHENASMAESLQSVNDALTALKSSTRTDDMALRDKLAALRAEAVDQETKQALEVKEIKSKFAIKMQVRAADQEIRDASELRGAELLREYERLRGIKMQMTSELTRLRTVDLDQRIAFEEKVRDIEARVAREDRANNEHVLGRADKDLREVEKVSSMLDKKLEQQSNEIQKKRAALYDSIREMELGMKNLEESISDRRLQLALKQAENEKIGHFLRMKSEQSHKLEEELRDMRRAFEKMGELEREKKEDTRTKTERLKAIK